MARQTTDEPGGDLSAEDRADARLAVGGDVEAFERIYRRHVPRVHGLARRMLDADLADEVTQDVFVRVWEKLGTYRGEAALGTWLHRVAVNVILARRKRLGIQRERFRPDGEARLAFLAGRRDRADLAVDLESGMARLPPGARQVFVLHDVEGFKHVEIADMLGVTTGTTKAQLHRARMILRQHFAA
ncbi:MAG: RNA polymerase sigma factor [Gemmatimonadota bacterium]